MCCRLSVGLYSFKSFVAVSCFFFSENIIHLCLCFKVKVLSLHKISFTSCSFRSVCLPLFFIVLQLKITIIMCEYSEIEDFRLSNGKTVKEVNDNVRKEVENIYLEGWAKGISVPFWDNEGRFYLANPDGSEDMVRFDRKERSYTVVSRVAEKGKGRYAYLLK